VKIYTKRLEAALDGRTVASVSSQWAKEFDRKPGTCVYLLGRALRGLRCLSVVEASEIAWVLKIPPSKLVCDLRKTKGATK